MRLSFVQVRGLLCLDSFYLILKITTMSLKEHLYLLTLLFFGSENLRGELMIPGGVEKGYFLTMCMSLEKRRKIYLRNNDHFLELLPSKAFSSS